METEELKQGIFKSCRNIFLTRKFATELSNYNMAAAMSAVATIKRTSERASETRKDRDGERVRGDREREREREKGRPRWKIR